MEIESAIKLYAITYKDFWIALERDDFEAADTNLRIHQRQARSLGIDPLGPNKKGNGLPERQMAAIRGAAA